MFFSGRVMTDDGAPPPRSAEILMVCGGRPRPYAHTDSKGYFSFQLGGGTINTEPIDDASVGGMGRGGVPGSRSPSLGSSGSSGSSSLGNGLGGASALMGCDLQASLPGYRSEDINLATRRALDNPDVGTILLHYMGKVEGTMVSAASLAAPKDAKKAFEKGQELAQKNKLDDAAKSFEKAVQVYPKYASAWFELGQVQRQQNQLDAARKSYDAAVSADPKYIQPYLELSTLAARDQNWQALADTSERAVKLDAYDYPQEFFYNSVANYNLHNLDAADKSAREAEKLDTKNSIPKIHHLLGAILADRQDFSGAAEEMRTYLRLAPNATDADTVRSQISQLEKLAGTSAQAGQAPQQ
jgi:tetratricopeptide (TPR) repeat protein